MDVYIYKMNFLVDLSSWITYEVIILSEPKKDSLNLCLSISPFIVTISTLLECRRSFVSRPDLFCNRKNIVAPTLETNVQRVFKGILWFFKLSSKTFHLLPSRIKHRIFKNWIHFSFNFWVNKSWPKGQTETNFLVDIVLNKKWQKKREK